MKKTLTLILCCLLLLGTFCLLCNASSEQTTAQSEFTETTLPIRAAYLPNAPTMGIASGSFSMTMPDHSNATSYTLHWGDASGMPLEGFTPFFSGQILSKEVLHFTPYRFYIPENAQTVLVYTYSEQFGRSTVPYIYELGSYTFPQTGKQLGELVIVSDLHIGSSETADANLTAMLNDVVKTAPGAAGIIVVGDAVAAGDPEYYDKLKQLCAAVPGAPVLYCGIGERNYLSKDTGAYDPAMHAQNLQTYLDHLNHPFGYKPDKPYYSYRLGGVLMAFMGAESYEDGNAVYSTDQLNWLRGILSTAKEHEPVFVFMHEPLPDTVSGSLAGHGFGNVKNAQEIQSLLNEFPNAILFTGHSQWQLQANQTTHYLTNGTRIFNVAGVSHLRNDADGAVAEVAGSQGYYITVYEDALLIRGRDFTTGEWISSAYYAFSTKPAPVQTTQTTAAPKPTTTKKPAQTTQESTEESEETSIRELIPPLCILAGMTVVVFIFVFRKPKDQP